MPLLPRIIREFAASATHVVEEPKPDDLRALRVRRVADYFPAETLAGAAIELDETALRDFRRDFEALLTHRKRIQGLARAAQFEKWWRTHQAMYLTRPVLANYRDSGVDLGELLDDLHLHFMVGEAKQRRSRKSFQIINRVVRNRWIVSVAVSIAFVLSQSTGFIWSLVVLGPGVKIFNAYTDAVVTPLSQTAQQVGTRDLERPAGAIQAWLTSADDAKKVSREIRETTEKLKRTNFAGMTPEETQRKWSEFEARYFELFMSYQKTLPSHLRDGRAFFRDWMVYTQTAMASNLAAFDIQYWTHKRELAQSTNPRDRKLHQAAMEGAESRIAGALAAWKIYEFMYPEFTHQGLASSYQAFIKSMRYDIYVSQFAGRMEEVLRNMNADILMRDDLAKLGHGAKDRPKDRLPSSQAQAR